MLQIILAYFTASALSAIFMTSVILTVGLIVLQIFHTTYVTAGTILLLFGAMILGAISSTAIFMTFLLFIKSSSASGAFMGILSAASGFLIGAYIPISQFSDKVQTFCNLFPATHVTIMIRNILMRGVADKMNESIGGIDNGLFIETIKDIFSFNSHMFGHTLSMGNSLVYILGFMGLSIAFMVCAFSKTYKRA